jgi:hypothetical protein
MTSLKSIVSSLRSLNMKVNQAEVARLSGPLKPLFLLRCMDLDNRDYRPKQVVSPEGSLTGCASLPLNLKLRTSHKIV